MYHLPIKFLMLNQNKVTQLTRCFKENEAAAIIVLVKSKKTILRFL